MTNTRIKIERDQDPNFDIFWVEGYLDGSLIGVCKVYGWGMLLLRWRLRRTSRKLRRRAEMLLSLQEGCK